MFNNKEYVYRVYKEKSFSKAAESLYISQPALSSTIKKVEKRIGTPLFDRSTSPIGLTECGLEYIKCIEEIMDIEEEFENYLNNINELKIGRLAIGASNFFAAYILPPIIARFKERYPQITVDLVEADTASLEKLLFAGELDLIVDNYDFNEDIYDKHFFFSENMLLAVPVKYGKSEELTNYSLSRQEIIDGKHLGEGLMPVPMQLLADVPYILLRHGNDTRVRAEKLFNRYEIKANMVLELDQLATAYHLSCYGMGSTFASDTLIKKTNPKEEIVYYKIDEKYSNRINYFYYKRGKYLSKVMKEFLKIATK